MIQCNGNRREDFHYLDGKTPAFGPPRWVAGAIGNCTWTGVRLRDLLKASGMDVDGISLRTVDRPAKATQIGLLGYDHDECGNQYCCSIVPAHAGDDENGARSASHVLEGPYVGFIQSAYALQYVS